MVIVLLGIKSIVVHLHLHGAGAHDGDGVLLAGGVRQGLGGHGDLPGTGGGAGHRQLLVGVHRVRAGPAVAVVAV